MCFDHSGFAVMWHHQAGAGRGKGTNTTKNGGSQPGKILIPHQQEEETQSLSISWLFHTPGDINAPPGRERNPSISHLSINPPWCRCAPGTLRTGILPSLCWEKAQVHPKWHQPHLEAITSIFMSWQSEFYHTPKPFSFRARRERENKAKANAADFNVWC